MKENIIPVSRARQRDTSTASFFQDLIDREEESAIQDVLAYVNQSGASYTDEEIEDLIESRHNTVADDTRMRQLYSDIAETMPYEISHELFVISAVLFNKKGFVELLDSLYGKLFDRSAPDTGLPFEEILDENQKESFKKLHRILKAYKDHSEDQKIENTFLQLMRYYETNVSKARDIFLCKSPSGKFQKEFNSYPSLLKYAQVQEIMLHLCEANRFEDLSRALAGAPFLSEHLDYIKPKYSVQMALMFTNTSLSKFLNEKGKSHYQNLLDYYGKCKTLGEALQVYEENLNVNDLDPSSIIGLLSLYTERTLRMDFEQYTNTVRFSKRDIQEMCACAALPNGSDDPQLREFQLLFEMMLFFHHRSSIRQKQLLEKEASGEDTALVEKFRRTNQDLKTQNKDLEKELKSERELRKKAEAEIQKTKKYYKHTLEKENRALKRENEDLADQIKVLEEKIRLLENQDHLEEVHLGADVKESGDALLSHGQEADLWPDEERELILSILSKELPKLLEGSRRQLLVQDILSSNHFHGTHEIRKNNLKKTLKGFTTINAATEAKLKEQGFTLTKTKTHIKISFMTDPRYTYSMPATGSDFRNGDNLAAQINALIF